LSRPTIGITSYWAPVLLGKWSGRATVTFHGYVEGTRLAGGRPLVIPADPYLADDPDDVLDLLEGIVFVGGDDVAPELYGAERDPRTGPRNERRDAVELSLMRRALDRDLPVLAICRGSQVLNVALGGDLEQHVPDRVGPDVHKQVAGVFAEHDVEVVDGTKLASIVGGHTDVKSHHHQGYGKLGTGLREAARATDGTVEALEEPTRRFTLGVLWHPEEGEDLALFEALVAEAAAYRAARHT
jgi:gamma-glutamyl-gamma-aminobutyrate hydrolase PuuD